MKHLRMVWWTFTSWLQVRRLRFRYWLQGRIMGYLGLDKELVDLWNAVEHAMVTSDNAEIEVNTLWSYVDSLDSKEGIYVQPPFSAFPA